MERLAGHHPAVGKLRLGVAFNACLPTEAEREKERDRLARKLSTGLVDDVWLNTGVDEELLGRGIAFIHGLQADLGLERLELFASAMLPSEAQLCQMRERPWNGVQFSDEFLGSVQGMGRATSKALAVFRSTGVQPIIESKVRNVEDLNKLEALLCGRAHELNSLLGGASGNAGDGACHSPVRTVFASKGARDDAPDGTTKNGVGGAASQVTGSCGQSAHDEGSSSHGKGLGKSRLVRSTIQPKATDESQLQRFPRQGRRWGRGRGIHK